MATQFASMALLLAWVSTAQAGSVTFTTAGANTWTAPAGVTSVVVEVWGGGGAGGGNTTAADGGGGGGGGGYSPATIAVTPGSIYSLTVGAKGTGVAGGTGNPGAASFFIDATTVRATGGGGGAPPVSGAGGVDGAGGAATAGTGFSGGTGGTGRNNNFGQGGPGGSSAGTAANGTNGPAPYSRTAAQAPPTGGGIGGNGGLDGFDGLAPASGNGGGGGGSGDTGTRTGGNGADGKVIISWYPKVVSINRVDPDPTSAASVSWTVTFSESVTGVDSTDFVLVQAGGVSGATITSVTGSGTTWTVTAGTGSGNGTLGLNLVDNNTIIDAGLLPLGGTVAGDGNFTGQFYTISGPTVAKSFAPGTITEGAASVLTITLDNPLASAVTGVSFTDTYPAGMVNTASANGASTCGGTVTAANGGGSVALSGGTIPASGSCTVTVNVTSATAGSYSNSTGTVTHASGTIPAASATLTVNAGVYGGFNACDVAATCTNNTPSTYIKTKIAGAAFNLDLVALKTDGSRNTNYGNNVTVELLNSSDNSGALDSYGCRSTWTAVIETWTSTGFGANGLLTTGLFTVPEAYRDVRVRVTNVGGVTKIGCSTDNFAIRPATFTLIAQDNDAQTAGTTRTLNNVVVTSGPVHKAGQPFIFTATAYNAAGSPAPTTNYVNNVNYPSRILSACAGTACTASFGTFDPGVTSFTSGTLSSNVATYSEVGAFNLTLQDTDFASVDAADTAASCAGYYVCSAATPVGRFVPDHFDTAVVATATLPMPCPTGLTCPSLYDGFVYSGQTFTTQVTAKNMGGGTTQNYQGAFARTVTLSAWDAIGGAVANPGGGTLTFNSVPSTAFILGVVTTSTPVYTFPVTPVAPTDIFVRADEPAGADGVTSLRGVSSVEGGVKVVSARAKISNAYGSELLPLPMTATVQFYNTAGSWATSTTDSVTSFNTSTNIVATIVTGPLAAVTVKNAGVVTVAGGVKTFVLNKPLLSGSADISLNTPDYLLAGSNGAGVNPSIAGRASFGVYKGRNGFIYQRESY